MNTFKIQPDSKYLRKEIQGYYRYEYTSYKDSNNIETRFLNDLKNTSSRFRMTGEPDFPFDLEKSPQNDREDLWLTAAMTLEKVLDADLVEIKSLHNQINLTICVIPRSKAEDKYFDNQRLFRKVVSVVVDKIDGLTNGVDWITRHTDTRTTHLDKYGKGGSGDIPYRGITKATCTISDAVQGKDILLIDDIYTSTVNIDEDAIQALLDRGASSVIFYAVAKTIYHGN